MAHLSDPKRPLHLSKIAALAVSAVLVACGGGGGSAPVANSPGIPPSSQSAQQCSADNVYAATALKTGSLSTEKQWLRSYFDEAYLWYTEVPTVDASAAAYSGADVYTATKNYFSALKTKATTPSGRLKDQFGFTYPTAAWNALSQSGVAAGYGFEFVIGSPTPPNRNLRIVYVEPGSEAAIKGLQRGDKLLTVDGVSSDDGSAAVLNAALFPSTLGVAHPWVFSRVGSPNLNVTLTSANITKSPVLMRSVITASDGKKIGYMVFNDHLATAEAQLVEAVNFFKAQPIDELVLDIRYNGGGYLYIASELAYMIAGPTRTQGKVFEQLVFNDKRSAETNSPDAIAPFSTTARTGAALPSLSLARVYLLTQSGTCSASESIINSLRGVDVDVRLIGGTTCGKPYGFYAKDNCGISYFPIEFKGANAKGFGDYADGFVPAGTGATGVAGCTVADDLSAQLGDPNEAMLATALGYRIGGVCSVPAGRVQPQSAARAGTVTDAGVMLRGPARENRIMLPRP